MNVRPEALEAHETGAASERRPVGQQGVPAAGVHAIDFRAFELYLRAVGLDRLEEPHRSLENELRSRGVLVESGGNLHPTLYGLLAFGKDPQGYADASRFWIHSIAYEGGDRDSEVLQSAEARGRLDEQVKRAIDWARGLGRFERYEGVLRRDTSLVPLIALREALVNAVAHRDYAITGSKVLLEVFSDRVDITSPGTLPNTMTVDRVRAGGNPRSRNELMANYLLVMGLMKRRGCGWPLIRQGMKDFNGTDPELREDREGRFVRVTLKLGGQE